MIHLVKFLFTFAVPDMTPEVEREIAVEKMLKRKTIVDQVSRLCRDEFSAELGNHVLTFRDERMDDITHTLLPDTVPPTEFEFACRKRSSAQPTGADETHNAPLLGVV